MLQEIMPFVSRHPILSLAWIALLVAVIVVVDTRSRDDFRRGHLASAINLTASEIKSGSLGELEKHKAQPIIVVCANGTASREPAENLSKAGFEKVTMLKDGIAGWSGENLPLVRGK